MSEPTKEAIEEARQWRKELGRGVLMDSSFTTLEQVDQEIHRRTAIALADVRKQAREDALEAAIVTGGIWVQAAYIAQFNASLRALKTQGDAQ